jgi:hypothetical protein
MSSCGRDILGRIVGLAQHIDEFGSIDAESERQLAEFFVKTDAYGRIEDQEHIIVSGRKGTGKTAIYEALLRRMDIDYSNTSAAGLRFQDYPWGVHAEVSDGSASPVERYAASWKFLILIELSKLALKNPGKPASSTATTCERVLGDFIRANWGQLEFSFKDVFRKRRYTFDFGPSILGNSLGSLKMTHVPRAQLSGVLRDANSWLAVLLSNILDQDHWYYVAFDDLDRGFDPDDGEYLARITGLLLASREIFHWAKDRSCTATPVVFIRSDIYEHLSFPDKNKITQNLLETLTWTDADEGENSLKSLIDQRIRVITGTEVEDPWSEVFSPQLMRGTQKKFNHIAARTYLRPRDMIKFCNLCAQEARGDNGTLIENEHIAQARSAYSEYLVNELDDEIHDVSPRWRDYLDVLRRVHKMRFARSDFDTAFSALRLNKAGVTADDALELLYRFSIVGFTKFGGGGYGGSAVAFRYKDPAVSFDPSATRFHVHAGLKDALELVESGE